MTISKWIILAIITISIAVLGTKFAENLNRTTNYAGTDIKISIDTQHYMDIGPQNVHIAAASSDFFVLRKASGETIVGSPQKPPLYWTGNSYFGADNPEASGGVWLVANGSPIVEITSDTQISVRVMPTESYSNGNKVAAWYLGFLIWIGILLILSLFNFYA